MPGYVKALIGLATVAALAAGAAYGVPVREALEAACGALAAPVPAGP